MSTKVESVVLTLRQLVVYLNRSVASIRRDIVAGRMPAGFRLGRSVCWLRAEVDAWLAAGTPPVGEWSSGALQSRKEVEDV